MVYVFFISWFDTFGADLMSEKRNLVCEKIALVKSQRQARGLERDEDPL